MTPKFTTMAASSSTTHRPAAGVNTFYEVEGIPSYPRISSTGGLLSCPRGVHLLTLTPEASDEKEAASSSSSTVEPIEIANDLTVKKVERIWQLCDKSPVGINNTTVMNEKVRESMEYTGPSSLNRNLFQALSQTANEMAAKLQHPTGVQLEPYKFIIYGPGGHFDPHIDSVHEEGMIMTLVVQFPLYLENGDLLPSTGGQLTVGTEGGLDQTLRYDGPGKDQLALTLFYHDTVHEVSEVEVGYRVSMTFNVYPTSLRQIDPIPQLTLGKLKARGVRKIGLMLSRIYLAEWVLAEDLKGSDRLYYEQLKASGLEVEVVEMFDYDGSWIRGEIMNLIRRSDAFETLYSEEVDDYDHKDYYEQITHSGKSFDTWSPTYSKDDRYDCVRSRYLLGDSVFLHGPAMVDPYFTANDEVFLGNEGFNGENITRTWALIAHLPK